MTNCRQYLVTVETYQHFVIQFKLFVILRNSHKEELNEYRHDVDNVPGNTLT